MVTSGIAVDLRLRGYTFAGSLQAGNAVLVLTISPTIGLPAEINPDSSG
jgi:hypothetical protein